MLFLCCSLFACQSDSDSGSTSNSTTTEQPASTNAGTGTGFQLLSPEQSGVQFANNLTEDTEQNYLNFEYIYNGGGVAVGDINNDGLPDLYFSGNEVPNKLYLNKGNLKFEDITEQAGVAADEGWYTGVSMVDINNDGWLDIYVCKSDWRKKGNYDRRNLLYINQGDGTFQEKAEEYRLAENGYSIQASFFDYDKDGDLDVYITNHPMEFGRPIKNRDQKVANPPEAVRDKLYRNNGKNTFSEVGKKAGIVNYSHGLGIVTADVNQDGWVDVYVTNDYDEPDFLYLNQGDGTFKESLQEMTGHISLFAMGVDIADINNDALPDIMTTEMLPESYKRSKTNMASMEPERFVEMTQTGLHHQYMHNSLQLNRGNQQFSEISQLSGISKTDWSWACLISDYNNDGWKDIFVANGYKRDVFDKDFAKKSAKIIHKNNGNIPLYDLYEIMPSTKLTNYLYQNNGDLTFSKKSPEWGLKEETLTQGAAIADLDLDGDLDLVLNNLDDPAMVYRNLTNDQNNYLRIQLKGGLFNQHGLGAKVTIRYDGTEQYQEMITVRGYQSSSEPVLHFGLGQTKTVEAVEVVWLNGQVSQLKDVASNQVLTIDQKEASGKYAAEASSQPLLAERSKNLLDQPFVHQENTFDDYQVQVLLPHKLSQLGPFTAVGDVNGDGLEDFYVGGAMNQAGALYLQRQGGFKKQKVALFETDKTYEDMDALFFDADQDGDQDLYVVSGGTELPAKHAFYQDRLYLNDGRGGFSKSTGLPQILASGSCVEAHDFDKDGDLDLFVGGRVIPNLYPYSTQTYLFRNDGGTFTDIALETSRGLVLQGMVTSAVWTDFDQDGAEDLIVVGEWMPIKFFKNQNGAFVEVTDQYGMSNTVGWWNKIVATDFDQDGDEDFVIGNLGLNYKFHASNEKPFHVYCDDFDGNQTMDIVLAKYDGDTRVPIRGRQCSSEQMPFVAQKFPTYNAFADASVDDILGEQIGEALHYEARIFESIILVNEGGQYQIKKLPVEAQFSTINGIVPGDFDDDGHIDLLLAGNMYGSEPETTRADASIGLLLKGDAQHNFTALAPSESGFVVPYDVKDLQTIQLGKNKQTAILVTCNDDALRVYTEL
ncbi:MAG: VCBS repeat-containing protein [Bacteroidota bacterium]